MGNTQTKQLEVSKTAQRRSSIAWNFRYPVTRRRDQTTTVISNDQLSVAEWLYLLDLKEYEGIFDLNGCVEDLLDLDETTLIAKGVRDASKRFKMLSSLVRLKAKRRQSMNVEVLKGMMNSKNIPIEKDSEMCAKPGILRNKCGRSSLRVDRGAVPKHRLTFDPSLLSAEDDDKSSIYEPLKSKSSTTSADNSSNSMATSSTPTGTLKAVPNKSHASQPSNEQQEALALKKALEWELGLDSRDLRSHAWYHGPLPRTRAEEIVQREGEFLIRDCASQPDNYVLTCRTKTATLHFVINKILLQPETVYERIQYQFEEDAFDAVPDLITFYVGSGKPISAASGARIQYPCNRTYPLSFYGHKIVGNQMHTQMLAGIRGPSPLNSPLCNNGGFRFLANGGSTGGSGSGTPLPEPLKSQQPTPMSSPPRIKRDPPPRLPLKQQRSQSLTPVQALIVSNIRSAEPFCSSDILQPRNTAGSGTDGRGGRRFSKFEKSNSISGTSGDMRLRTQFEHLPQQKTPGNGFQTIARCSMGDMVDHVKFTTHSLPRPNTSSNLRGNCLRVSSLAREFGPDTSSLNNIMEGHQIPEIPEQAPSPPPKPSRSSTLTRKDKEDALQRLGAAGGLYQASGSDSGNGSGDSIPGVDATEISLHRGVIIKNPRFLSNSGSSATLKSLADFDVAAAEAQLLAMDITEFKSLSRFDVENFSTLLLPAIENKPLDGDALNTFKIMLLETGPKIIAEHITRIDVAFLIDDILPEDETNFLDCCGLEMLTLPHGNVFRQDLIERTQCIKLMVAVTILTCQTDLDRAKLLSKWIQVAVETKTALGNLFGFCAIMLGLCMQQIQKLDQAWHVLRQQFTDSAFTFEAKLRPTLISMNECTNPQAPNTTVPHVLTYALLIDRPATDILNVANTEEKSALYNTCISAWENKADDFGLFINFLHLDSARGFLKNIDLFRKNAKLMLEESSCRLDELLSDAFRTEFHVKFLWGSKGALASAEDRHTKLEKVLALMADKFCSIDNSTDNVEQE